MACQAGFVVQTVLWNHLLSLKYEAIASWTGLKASFSPSNCWCVKFMVIHSNIKVVKVARLAVNFILQTNKRFSNHNFFVFFIYYLKIHKVGVIHESVADFASKTQFVKLSSFTGHSFSFKNFSSTSWASRILSSGLYFGPAFNFHGCVPNFWVARFAVNLLVKSYMNLQFVYLWPVATDASEASFVIG